MGRWDHLFDAKPRPLVDFVLDEAAKEVARQLADWPPTVIEWSSEVAQRRFAPLWEPGARRPDGATFREAFRLARWEMRRDVEAIDRYMKHKEWSSAGVSEPEHLALLFAYQFLVEQMLGLADATQGRLKRLQLEECLVRCEKTLERLVGESP